LISNILARVLQFSTHSSSHNLGRHPTESRTGNITDQIADPFDDANKEWVVTSNPQMEDTEHVIVREADPDEEERVTPLVFVSGLMHDVK
jgi:hypothetical protein